MNDSKLKDLFRSVVKRVNRIKHDKYQEDVKQRGKHLLDFSILSSDCIAGLIYHSLNRKFLSPTINLSIPDKDFLKLLENLDYYMSQKIEFLDSDTYPKGCLGSENKTVRLNFEHYASSEEAERKWEERKTRLLDRRFIIMADQNLSDEEIQAFYRLKCTRKVMFTWNPERHDGKEIICIKTYGRPSIKNYSKLRIDGFRDYERFFDFVSWLDMQDNFMKETGVDS